MDYRSSQTHALTTIGIVSFVGLLFANDAQAADWKKHIVFEGAHCNTAVAGDYSGDGKPDIICSAAGVTRLFVAPDWREVAIDAENKFSFIHSETMDVDGDGDLDFIGARYKPGLIAWYEQPEKPLTQRWPMQIADEKVIGIHGVLVGDVNGDGRSDLLANSAQPLGDFPDSLVWYDIKRTANGKVSWKRNVVANGDAPGLTHYLGLGDVDGDGRADVATGAKGGPQDPSGKGNYFAWWKAPKKKAGKWTKQIIASKQPGATNIHPTDVDGDGRMDFIASRGHGHGLIWFESPSWKERVINPDLEGPHCLAVADMDGDGDIDAATCAKDSKVAAWFENDGKGKFKTHVIDSDQAAYDIRAVDIDVDGDLDLLVAGQASQNVVWYENPVK